MAQFARPSTDTVNEGYTNQAGGSTDIFNTIDEVTADDGDYVRSPLIPTNDVYVTKLTAITDPQVSTGHITRFRYGKDVTAGAQIDQLIELRQGYVSEASLGTLIATLGNFTNVAVFPVAGSYTLSGAEADAITNYADLFIRIRSNQV